MARTIHWFETKLLFFNINFKHVILRRNTIGNETERGRGKRREREEREERIREGEERKVR